MAFVSTAQRELALKTFQRAAVAHGEDEKHYGQRDGNWPDWYAAYLAPEQAGTELPMQAISAD
jgi:hypothetical protein